jgi:pyruvate,water dikinase
MKRVVPLAKALDEKLFGSKAVGLGQALRDGVPVPPGIALSGAVVEAVAAGEDRAIRAVDRQARPLGGPLAVRSSAADEDGAEASFAGQHLTLLNVPSADALVAALKEIWWSANSDSRSPIASGSACSPARASASSSRGCSIPTRLESCSR